MAPPPSSSSPRPKVVGGSQAKSTSASAAGASDTLPSSSASNPYATIDFPDGISPHQRPTTPPLPPPSEQPFPGISWPVPVDYSILEYPKESLKPVKKLGDGQFGDVYLCEINCLQEGFVDGRPDSEAKTMLVAVKMLRSNADDQTR